MKSFQEWIDERDATLETLGFSSYNEYLLSDLWDTIRSRLAKEEKSCCCYLCGSTSGLSWHHVSYHIRVLVGNFSNVPRSIFRLCCDCHRAIHTDGTSWFSPEEVHSRLNGLHRGYRRGVFERDPARTREDFLLRKEEWGG